MGTRREIFAEGISPRPLVSFFVVKEDVEGQY